MHSAPPWTGSTGRVSRLPIPFRAPRIYNPPPRVCNGGRSDAWALRADRSPPHRALRPVEVLAYRGEPDRTRGRSRISPAHGVGVVLLSCEASRTKLSASSRVQVHGRIGMPTSCLATGLPVRVNPNGIDLNANDGASPALPPGGLNGRRDVRPSGEAPCDQATCPRNPNHSVHRLAAQPPTIRRIPNHQGGDAIHVSTPGAASLVVPRVRARDPDFHRGGGRGPLR